MIQQLFIAGLHLSEILEKLFVSTTPTIVFVVVAKNYKNGIEAKDFVQPISKKSDSLRQGVYSQNNR